MQTTFKLTTKELHNRYGARCISAVGRGHNSLVKFTVPGLNEIMLAEFPNLNHGCTGGTHKYVHYPEGYTGDLLHLGSEVQIA